MAKGRHQDPMLDGAFFMEVVQQLDGPLFHHLASPVLQVLLGSFHEVVLELSYAVVEPKVFFIQGGIEVSLVARFCHTELDLQVTDLAIAL